MFELQLIDAPGLAAGSVPIPVEGRAVLFVGSDGRMRARMPDGSFVLTVEGRQGGQGENGEPGSTGAMGAPGVAGAVGAMGAPGVAGAVGAAGAPGVAGAVGAEGAPGAPGKVVSLHTSTLSQSRPGLAGGLLLHDFTFGANLVGRMVRARGLLSVNSNGSVGVSALLNIGGLVCEFSQFQVSGARLLRFDLDMHVQAVGVAQGGAYQGSAAPNATAAMVYAQRVATAGSVSTQKIDFSIKGNFSAVTVLSASIEVL